MIVLLGYSTNLYANNPANSLNPSTGKRVELKDSVLIAYDDLRIVNSKLIQLEYEQQVNTNLRNVIHNDSIVIQDYKVLNERINKDCKKAIKQRNIAIGVGALFVITSLLLLLK